jgi:hypothetical protein
MLLSKAIHRSLKLGEKSGVAKMDANDLLDIPPFPDRRPPEEIRNSDGVVAQLVPDVVCERGLIVSVIKYEDPVGKCFGYQGDKVTKAVLHRSQKAVAKTISFPSFEDFATCRKALTSEYMITSGTFDAAGEVPVVYDGKESSGEVSATKKFLAHRNHPGILIVDIDYKKADEVAGLYLGGEQPYETHNAALEALRKILPELDGCALMIGWSTSSNIFNKAGNQVKGTGGIRIYIPVTDASKIPELLDLMHKRSWLCGEGWAFVAVGGGVQERSLVDKALGRPAQPDYAAPGLRNGLTQDREWTVHEGKHLDPDSVAPLTAEEKVEYLKAVEVAKDALAANMKAERNRYVTKCVAGAVAKGIDPKRAKSAAIQRLDNGVLFPSDTVFFDGGSEVAILELLTDGAAYDGKTCMDPVEPDYNDGAPVGQYYWNDGDRPGIHSFAHGSKWYALKYDEGSLRAVIATKNKDDIIRALALSRVDKMTSAVLVGETARTLGLGNNRRVITDAISSKRSEAPDLEDKGVADKVIKEGRWPLDKALPPGAFPFHNDGSLLCHEANYAFMLKAYDIEFGYDMISKELIWSSSGLDTETDNAKGALFSRIKSLAALNNLSNGNDTLHVFLPAIAEAKQINRVRDHLKALKWDGKDRFGLLAAALGSHDLEIANISIGRWLIQACATADGAELGRKHNPSALPVFEYVLALHGDQGAGKTKGLTNIMPTALRSYLKESVVLNINNKDSVKLAVSCWLAELGELDATFRAADHVAFKAFMSREHDELRMPYAAKSSRFRRRTVFVGSVNEPEFLKDKTGARRFFPLSVIRGFPAWPEAEVNQLWAQAWALYASGSQWWPNEGEQKLLDTNAEAFRQKSWAELRLEEIYDWGQGPDGSRTTATKIWVGINSYEGSPKMSSKEQNDLTHALKRLWLENGAYGRDGILVIDVEGGDTVKVNSNSGKNRGWLLPPISRNLSTDFSEHFPTGGKNDA